ncbi:hypothetical protein B0A48_06999 [Cryoendolithus antarcticus]|uniref:xylan 1,4-beta-xylosidase n=1 Tax=Cryoendolithus antarcticus TaxID=1507870 RepID=A0A1V8TAA2_9PEZI|nr:hypothetical protein B0A48_06999 [Cryoendolithus antarcticus]
MAPMMMIIKSLAFFAVSGALAQSSNFVCTASAPNATQYNASTTYLGCWTDATVRTLDGPQINNAQLSPQYCANRCGNAGYIYSGVEYTTQCFCGTAINPVASQTNESACTYICPGDTSAKCGGTYLMNLYKINNPNPNPPPRQTKFQPACLTNPFCSQKACDTSLSIAARVAALISNMTLIEKAQNLVDAANGVERIGLPSYEWWSEALHGVASSPGVTFNSPNGSDFSYATSFPTPILLGAAFDDPLIYQIASTVGKEARAFGNYMQSGFDFWTPNINTFLDPRWGRGLEVPTEDSFHAQSYVSQLIPGLQGGLTAGPSKQIIATCKHYAVYDVEELRNSQNYNPTQQDLGEYYLTPFKTCVRDVDVGSVMCSYNAVDGVPACASEYLLQDVLRDAYGFDNEPYRYVTSDCGAVDDIYNQHNFTDSFAAAAAVAINAGTDTNCGSTYLQLNTSVARGFTTNATLDRALTRLYTALFTVGYFDGQPKYDQLSFSDVSTGAAQSLAYTAAWEGMTLLKNNGVLPLKKYNKVAMIGPWANATGQMQGNYQGIAPYLISPLQSAQAQWGAGNVVYAQGTAINSTNTTGFAAALSAAKSADLVVFLGGIDTSIESEGHDRTNIDWPGNQLDLVAQLSQLRKPLVVAQFGGGQVDDTALLQNRNVHALIWGGYPGQAGGAALIDVLIGKQAPAGRLAITQYAGSYINQVSKFDPNLRPGPNNVGRTYKWLTTKAVLPFGYGLHYTSFKASWSKKLQRQYNIADLVSSGHGGYGKSTKNDASQFATVTATVRNTGRIASDYVALLFLSSSNAGPTPRPKKSLVSYNRAHNIAPRGQQQVSLPLTLGSIARADVNGDLTIYPGDYQLALDFDGQASFSFSLRGRPTIIDPLPRQRTSYNYTVPVHPQA